MVAQAFASLAAVARMLVALRAEAGGALADTA
jgi:hypothetical protein